MNSSENRTLGVALTKCFYCLEGDRLILNTRLTRKPPSWVCNVDRHVVDMDPCPKCNKLMQQGIILITIDPSKSDPGWEKKPIPNPYRTGGFFVIKQDALKKFLPGSLFEYAVKSRWIFIEHTAAEQIGLFDRAEVIAK